MWRGRRRDDGGPVPLIERDLVAFPAGRWRTDGREGEGGVERVDVGRVGSDAGAADDLEVGDEGLGGENVGGACSESDLKQTKSALGGTRRVERGAETTHR